MKLFLIGLFACILMNSPLQAQLIRSYGAKVAYTSAYQDYKYSHFNLDSERRSGVNFAAFVEWLDVPFVSVVTQMEYAQRGRSYEIWFTDEYNPDGFASKKITDRVDYLSIPIVGKFRFPLGMFSPFVTAGPRVDFFLAKKDEVFLITGNEPWKKTNLGATVSLGSEFKTPLPLTFSLEARYNFDLADSYSTEHLKVRNNSFDLWLGVGL